MPVLRLPNLDGNTTLEEGNKTDLRKVIRKIFYQDLDQIYPPGSFLNAFFKDEDFVEALAEAPAEASAEASAEAEEVLIEVEEEEEDFEEEDYDYEDSLYNDLEEYLAALEEEEEEKEKEEEDEEEINIII